jgi:hypothetical protein
MIITKEIIKATSKGNLYDSLIGLPHSSLHHHNSYFYSIKNLKTMPNSETCERCKGKGYYEALVSQHDDKKETVKCEKCNGKGTVYQMTESEERDYWEDYW